MINLEQEIWVDIAGFENYEISNYGKIKNKINQNILKQTLRSNGYYQAMLRKNDKQYSKFVHRLIASHFIPNPKNLEFVDHKDNCTTNNNISNLRWCSRQQNSMNQKKRKNSSSKFKGVCFDQNSNKWRAYIKKDWKLIHLGLFVDEEDAARAYDCKAIEHFGEFAKINFPREDYQEEEEEEEEEDQEEE
uniref:Endonuclease n=1 Tax=Tetrahymena thermophila TaxID=5911 RepID=Q8WRA0_TETTH|nr:endonuclease [Tetrahymena thermophila]